MAGITGMKWSARRTTELAEAVDGLTQQMLLANQMNAAHILVKQGALSVNDYSLFLQGIMDLKVVITET